MTSVIEPAREFPFATYDAVYFLPSATLRMLAPAPLIRAVVYEPGPYSTIIWIEADKRLVAVNTRNLSFSTFCERCQVPGVRTFGPRGWIGHACPDCQGAVVDEPPSDKWIVQQFPLCAWHTPMVMHRAVCNPTWTYRMALHDSHATIERTYRRMLVELDLTKPTFREGQQATADLKQIDLLKFYALLGHKYEFMATYEELMTQQAEPAYLIARSVGSSRLAEQFQMAT